MGRPLIACSGRVGASPAQEGHAGVNDLRGPRCLQQGLPGAAPGSWMLGPPGTPRHQAQHPQPDVGELVAASEGLPAPQSCPRGWHGAPYPAPYPGASQGSAQRLCPAPAELVWRLKAQRDEGTEAAAPSPALPGAAGPRCHSPVAVPLLASTLSSPSLARLREKGLSSHLISFERGRHRHLLPSPPAPW